MTIGMAVDVALAARQLQTYPGRRMLLPKTSIKENPAPQNITDIEWDVYRKVESYQEATGADLMKLIDDELESRGYYAIGETQDTPLKLGPEGTTKPAPSHPAELLLDEIEEKISNYFDAKKP